MPGIIFLTGILSAFFVNDIICLAMAPFAITAAKRMGLKPVPYVLAVATASNIGSVASITGNPQNMLIGSYSGIRYRDFLVHLGPVAIAGLLLDWLVLWLLCTRNAPPAQPAADPPERKIGPRISEARNRDRWRVGGVPRRRATGVVRGHRCFRHVGDAHARATPGLPEVDWGLLVFFLGLFLIVGGAENAGLTQKLLAIGRGTLIFRTPPSYTGLRRALQRGEQRSRGYGPEILCGVVYKPTPGLVRAGNVEHACGKLDDHRLGGEHHRDRTR